MKKINNNIDLKIKDLIAKLENTGISTSLWGKGLSKTTKHLLKEIEEDETFLTTDQNGDLLRKVLVSSADIYYTNLDGKKLKLVEEKQIFNDGRKRTRNLNHSVSEKIKLNEGPQTAMIRGIKEELDIDGNIILTNNGVDNSIKLSDSYPGLLSEYTNYKFIVNLAHDQFDPKGYIENQSDKKTYFVWKNIN